MTPQVQAMPELPVAPTLCRDHYGNFTMVYEADKQSYEFAMRDSMLARALDAYALTYAESLKAELESARAALEAAWRVWLNEIDPDEYPATEKMIRAVLFPPNTKEQSNG